MAAMLDPRVETATSMVTYMSHCICTVLVVGGGLAGLGSAIALARVGHKVTVLEARKAFTEFGAGVQMPPNASRIMRQWGILDQLRARSKPPRSLVLRSYRDGTVLHQLTLFPDMEDRFGAPHLMLHRKDALAVLLDEARRLGVDLRVDSTVATVDFATPSVTTVSGEVHTADVIIGADGERSVCREALVGHPEPAQSTGKRACRFVVQLAKIRAKPSFHDLVDTSQLTCWWGPRAHVVVYELERDQLLNVVVLCDDPIKDRAELGPHEADVAELRHFLRGWDPILTELLNMAESVLYWPLFSVRQENTRWMDEDARRFVLLGDAAHSMPPDLAQGASQGIEDAAFLGCLFAHVRSKSQIQALLATYCEHRQARVLPIHDYAQRMRQVTEMIDGPEQRERDRQMREGEVFDGFPNVFADAGLQEWLYGYDITQEADKAWVSIEKEM